MLFILLVPEFLVGKALSDHQQARRHLKRMSEIAKQEWGRVVPDP